MQLTTDPVVLAAADGSRVPLGPPVVDGAGTVTVALPVLAPSTYEVAYRVLAEDSHVLEGRYSFAVEEAAPGATLVPVAPTTVPAATPPNVDDVEDDDSPIGMLLIGVAAAVGIAGGLLAWQMSRRSDAPG